MQDIGTLFADYATYHRTTGNKWFHRFGIPLIMLGGLGMLARLALAPYVDAGTLLIAIAAVVYCILDWRLAAMMVIVSIAFYLAGAALPFWINVTLFVVGWILQFVGHSVFEKRQPAFLTNALHLLVGPLWILNDVVHVVRLPVPASQLPAGSR
ncbi:MAG TPA: Mpo1-like protein [Thermoanaerobaculia bacterium]|nr:Mpo1-like protein [Thermoanaerobaculia bacterium]